LHLVIFVFCTLLLFVVTPYSYHITHCCFHALLHLSLMPCFSCVVPYCFCSHTLLFSFSRLAIRTNLLFAPCCSTFLVDGPCCPTIVPCYSPFSSTSCPLTPLLFCCLVVHYHTLLLCLVCWYSIFTLLCRWRSLEQHQQASSNNKGFFLPTFIEFFLFCLSFLF
jgi:hypothetical protein